MRTVLLILTIFISFNLNAIKPDFKSNVKIKGNEIFIKDILSENKFSPKKWAVISDLKIGEFKSGETYRNINSRIINEKIRPYNVQIGRGFITVRRFKYRPNQKKIKTSAINFLKEKYHLTDKDRIEFVTLPNLFSYSKNYDINFSQNTSDGYNQIRIKCQIKDGKFKYQPEYFSVEIKKFQKCFVVTKSVKLREKLQIGKNIKEENHYFSLNNNVIHNLEELQNVQTIKFLRKNQIIKENYVKRIPDIKRNSKVKVIVENQIIKLEINAKATSDGYIGDVIAFRNLESNKNFKAKIVDKNLAVIKF